MRDYVLTPRGLLVHINENRASTRDDRRDYICRCRDCSVVIARGGGRTDNGDPFRRTWDTAGKTRATFCYGCVLYTRALTKASSRWQRDHRSIAGPLAHRLSRDDYKIKTNSQPCAHDKETVEKVRPRRLISTRSIKLVDFGDNILIPDYAILSHTWGPGEVTFRDLDSNQHKGNVNASIIAKPGCQKIQYACWEARRRNLDYLWVDTCCINQEDNGDVHRNIKSMYAFYQNSSICYAYLSDRDSYNLSESSISTSRWFSRGWTLQELLAPPEVVFFDRNWCPLGTRSGRTTEISDGTGIPKGILEGHSCVHQASVEERMSWAVMRTTSRPQDQAYCLIGILGVPLEPSYDEDVNSAFFRLWMACSEKYPEEVGTSYRHGRDLFSVLVSRVISRTNLWGSSSQNNSRNLSNRHNYRMDAVEAETKRAEGFDEVLNDLLALLSRPS